MIKTFTTKDGNQMSLFDIPLGRKVLHELFAGCGWTPDCACDVCTWERGRGKGFTFPERTQPALREDEDGHNPQAV